MKRNVVKNYCRVMKKLKNRFQNMYLSTKNLCKPNIILKEDNLKIQNEKLKRNVQRYRMNELGRKV